MDPWSVVLTKAHRAEGLRLSLWGGRPCAPGTRPDLPVEIHLSHRSPAVWDWSMGLGPSN